MAGPEPLWGFPRWLEGCAGGASGLSDPTSGCLGQKRVSAQRSSKPPSLAMINTPAKQVFIRVPDPGIKG